MADDETKPDQPTDEQAAASAAATASQGAGVPAPGTTSAAATPESRQAGYFNSADNVAVLSYGRDPNAALQPEGTGMGPAGYRQETGAPPPGSQKLDTERLAEAQRQADALRDGTPIGSAIEITPPSADDHAVQESRADGEPTDAPPLADAPRAVQGKPETARRKR